MAANIYEAKRKRTFLPSWTQQYPWVANSDVGMFCTVCRQFPAKADRAGAFFTGTGNYRKHTLDAHDRSRQHIQCMTAKRMVDNPSSGPLNIWAKRANTDTQQRMEKLINTAYHTVKSEQPFTAYEKTISLLKKNGGDMGAQYLTDVACRRFANVIYDELWEGCAEEIKAAHFISVLADTATDVSGRDLEGVYIRILSSGRPRNVFVAVEELQHATAPGHYAAINTALEKADISQWKDKIVGFGSDGAAVMVGRLSGVTTLLRAEVPHLVNIQCLGHVLELAVMDVMKGNDRMRKVMDVLKGLHKQYHHSPKAWRELQELAEVLHQKIWKPTNLGGTRWLPHFERALRTLMKNYPVMVAQMENTVETRSASTEMIGRAKQCLQMLKDFQHLHFLVLVQDVLEVLSCLSLKLQEEGLTLPEALYAFETAVLRLTGMETDAGQYVEGFLEQTQEGSFQNVQLERFREDREVFNRVKRELLASVVASLQHRFQGVETHKVLLAASKIVNPREWPADHQELASYGSDHLLTVAEHFGNVLDRMGCDRERARRIEWPGAKVIIKSLPQGLQHNAWQDFFSDDDRKKNFSNLLLVVELILVMPLSTASVERGFSAMKRIKSDWRSKRSVNTLTRLLFISLEGPDMEQFNSMSAVNRWLAQADRRSLE